MEGTGTHLHVVGLQNDAALFGPVVLQDKDQVLKGQKIAFSICRISTHGESPNGVAENA
jgi:hypothetical protein